MVTETTELAPIAQGQAPRITRESVQETRLGIELLQSMVKGILKRGIDFGRIPGTPADSLWEPGAMQIISAFNCYPGERRLLSLIDNAERLTVIVEVPLLSRAAQRVLATGIGAASTLETKYKYRWFNKADAWQMGYDEEALQALKQRQGRNETEYRIPNPEHSELLNTIIKMASKRAEVDAAESLPGVSSVLREMFNPQAPAREAPGRARAPNTETQSGLPYTYTHFWGDVRKLGIDQTKAHELLNVASLKDWEASNPGKALKDALAEVREKLLWEKNEGSPESLFNR